MNLTNVLIGSIRSLSEELFDYVSSYDIYCELIGYELKVGQVILSPIRKDSRPTFVLFIPDDKDDVYFKDFAWVGGNVFKFVKLFALYQESINLRTRYEIIRYIDSRLGLGMFNGNKKKKIKRRKIDKTFYSSKRKILFKSREFTQRDLKYWSQYYITEETLKFYNVRSVHKLLNENNEVIYKVPNNKLTFAFVIYNKVKLYSPEENEFKWRNTCPAHYLQGIQQVKLLEPKDKLIITKSLKDVMVFHEFLKNKYHIIAPHSETYIFTEKLLKWIENRYKEVTIIFDYDLSGVSGANRLRKQLRRLGVKVKVKFISTKRIKVNGKIKTIDKDISDFVVGRTKEEIINKLKSLDLV